MSEDGRKAHSYEIRVAGVMGEGLLQAFSGMRAGRLGSCALLRIEVPQGDWDAADIVALLGERGHFVTSIRRCAPKALGAAARAPTSHRSRAGHVQSPSD